MLQKIRQLTPLSVGGLTLLLLSVLAPAARADIIEVEGATSCPGSLGGGLCNGSVPYELSALLMSLETPGSIGNGTQKYVVTDDIGSGFTFDVYSIGQNNTGIANNGQCQVNGGAMSLFDACSITDNIGQTTSLRGPQINGMVFPITITFSGAAAMGATFDLGFVSMQGSSNAAVQAGSPTAPLALAAGGLLLVGVMKIRSNARSASRTIEL
jgi:hypothetical protein